MTTPHASANRTVPVEFTGKSGEYFKLWIVNLLLTVVTLGIYGAWAKVRNTQYLYGHTSVDGHRLRYLATPIQILKGRIIAAVIFAAFYFLSSVSPELGIMLLVALLIATPWLIAQSIRFSMRMTAYRNVRFSFTGTYLGILINFVLLPILSALTLYLIFPWVLKKMHQYTYENITFGGKPLKLNNSTGHYYFIFMACFGLTMMAMVAMLVVASIVGVGIDAIGGGESQNLATLFSMGLVFAVGYFLIVFGVKYFFQAQIRNHVYSNLSLDGVASCESGVGSIGYIWLGLSNGFLQVITLGLAYPVTQIRTAAYLAKSTQLTIEPGMNELVNTVSDKDSAFGEEAADIFDADVSLV